MSYLSSKRLAGLLLIAGVYALGIGLDKLPSREWFCQECRCWVPLGKFSEYTEKKRAHQRIHQQERDMSDHPDLKMMSDYINEYYPEDK